MQLHWCLPPQASTTVRLMRRRFQAAEQRAIEWRNCKPWLAHAPFFVIMELGKDSLPAHSETPSRIEETRGVSGERASDWEQDSQLSKSLDGAEHEHTDQDKSNNQRCRPTLGEG